MKIALKRIMMLKILLSNMNSKDYLREVRLVVRMEVSIFYLICLILIFKHNMKDKVRIIMIMASNTNKYRKKFLQEIFSLITKFNIIL